MNEPLQTDTVTLGTGSRVGVTEVGTIKFSICDKFGNIVIKTQA